MTVALDLYLTMALAVAVYYLGVWLKGKVAFLAKFCIPAPVAGGLVFAIAALLLKISGIMTITLDTSLQTLFMTAFFTSVGFTASIKVIRQGGILVAKFIAIVTLLVLLQDLVGAALSIPFGLNPLLGLCTASIPMTGGHGNAASFGPLLEDMGVTGATTVSVAAATFGLVAGSVMGGPIARRLIARHNISTPRAMGKGGSNAEISAHSSLEEPKTISAKALMPAAAQLFIAMGIGSVVSGWISSLGITLPSFIGALLTAAVMRNISDAAAKPLALPEIEAIGEVSLGLFLSLALISLRLWELFDLALPMMIMLLAQVLLMAAFAWFVSYNVMGRDYTACCITAGLCGFGMGATPNAMANMDAVTLKFGECKSAYIVVAIVGGLFVNFANSAIVTLFINLLG